MLVYESNNNEVKGGVSQNSTNARETWKVKLGS